MSKIKDKALYQSIEEAFTIPKHACVGFAHKLLRDQHLNWIFVYKVAGIPNSRVSTNCRASHTQILLCKFKALSNYQPHSIKESNPSWITLITYAGNITVIVHTKRKHVIKYFILEKVKHSERDQIYCHHSVNATEPLQWLASSHY